MTFKIYLLLVCLAFVALITSTQAYNNTSDFYKCVDKVSGQWHFGRAPYACNADSFIDPDYVQTIFSEAIFYDATKRNPERHRYMGQLYPIVRDVARYYIKKRKPNVSTGELDAFEYASFAIAHQESFWSHYRVASDFKLKYMRGDSGHGHGIMQVDDRWHFIAITDGTASNLVNNIVYSLEEYYNAWIKFDSADCFTSTTDYRSRARAAYSAYNGGPKRICRYTNPDDRWARNDKGFVNKYDQHSWDKYVADPDATSSVNIQCIIEDNENCNLPPPIDPPDEKPSTEVIYVKNNDLYCIYDGQQFNCIDSEKDLLCLEHFLNKPQLETSVTLSSEFESDYPFVHHDRHDVCFNQSNSFGLRGISSSIRLHKNINFRATAGGTLLSTIPKDTVVQVLDFEVKDYTKLYRYYYVHYKNDYGYLYAGKLQDHNSWISASTKAPQIKEIPTKGDQVTIKNPAGINLRSHIGGNVLTVVPKEALLTVDGNKFKNMQNDVYLAVTYDNEVGFIYAGSIFPQVSISEWVTLGAKAPSFDKRGQLKAHIWYRYLKDCNGSRCYYSENYLFGPRISTNYKFKIITSNNGLSLIELERSGVQGWIKSKDIDDI
ncbi:MAG: hypothetical protein ISR65_03660 [Bacteriovoracaceae bacterium]|nr:hypothetical protein [Bacteriovoracaceae bacterium]